VEINIESDFNKILQSIPECIKFANRTNANIPFHYMHMPLLWWSYFNNTDGTIFSQKRGKNFLGVQSRLNNIYLLTVKDNGRMCGVVPLASYSLKLPNHQDDYRLLSFAGDYITATCQDFLVDPDLRADVIDIILRQVFSQFSDNHDLITFGYIAENSENIPYIQKYLDGIDVKQYKYLVSNTAQRGGVWPWTIVPLRQVCDRISKNIDKDFSAYENIKELSEKLSKTTPVSLMFPKTRSVLKSEFEALIPHLENNRQLIKEHNIVKELLSPTVITYPYISLPKDRDSYFQSLSKSKRYYFRRYYKKFLENGGRFEKITSDKITQQDIQDSFHLHLMRWGNESGILCNDIAAKFHEELALAMAKEGLFTIFFSTHNGKRIATHTCFDINGRREFYMPGRDKEYEKLRAGSLLVLETILDAIDNNFTFYDLGVVGFDYKRDFTKTAYTSKNYFIFKNDNKPDLDMIFNGFECMN
jgi:hypothetical protein